MAKSSCCLPLFLQYGSLCLFKSINMYFLCLGAKILDVYTFTIVVDFQYIYLLNKCHSWFFFFIAFDLMSVLSGRSMVNCIFCWFPRAHTSSNMFSFLHVLNLLSFSHVLTCGKSIQFSTCPYMRDQSA